jgi:hypothetical protein
MTNEDYPQEMSQNESDLGFRLLLIEGIGALMGSRLNPVPVPVVAFVLSSSDILVNIYDLNGKILYSHRRFGHLKGSPAKRNEWRPIANPVLDAKQLIYDFSFNAHREFFTHETVPVEFTYRPVSPE